MIINPAAFDAPAQRSAASRALMDRGYTIMRGAAPASLIADVADDLAPRYAATPFCEGGFYGKRTKRFGRLLIRSPRMADLVMNPDVLALAELALGNWCDRIQLNLAQAIELHPGALPQFPHRDQKPGGKNIFGNMRRRLWPEGLDIRNGHPARMGITKASERNSYVSAPRRLSARCGSSIA